MTAVQVRIDVAGQDRPLPLPICPEDRLFVKWSEKQQAFACSVRFKGSRKKHKAGTAERRRHADQPLDRRARYEGAALQSGLSFLAVVAPVAAGGSEAAVGTQPHATPMRQVRLTDVDTQQSAESPIP